tara:strand:+ start:401 stop:544 length:144 start_codon:yes stop_codon:yes gene_type:complete
MKNAIKIESYVWDASKREYVLETTTPAILLGMLKAKRLALKGLSNVD